MMSAMFETFPDSPEIISSTAPNQSEEAEKSVWQMKIEKRDKKIRKLKKKQKKLLQRIAELQARNAVEEQRRAEEDPAHGQSFFKVVGDAIKKAIPHLATWISTTIVGIFSKKLVKSIRKQITNAFAT